MEKIELFKWIFIGILCSGLLITYSLTIIYDDSLIKTPLQKSFLASEVKKNNLKMLDEKDILGEWESNKNLTEYHKFVKDNYHYNTLQFNCKYWALNWAIYLDKHNIDYKFIFPKNHISVMAIYEDKYIILDGKNVVGLNYIER